jgi:LysR family transcriptional activator of nhaA
MMERLNYKHLRYFRAVAHEGNLTRAAENLNVSQSALSSQIKKLEDRLGHALFDRRGRGLHLTEAGRIALDHADAIFATGDELVATLAGEAATGPILRVGALATLSRNFQIGFLRPVLERGDARIVSRSGSPETLLAELEAMELDVVLLSTAMGGHHTTPLRAHRLAEIQVSLIGTPARLEGEMTLKEVLADQPLILPATHGSIRTGFDALVQRLGVVPRIAAEADDMALMRLLAREDVGVAVLPPVVVKDELETGRLVEAHPLPGVVETFYAITLERRFPNALLPLILPEPSEQMDDRQGG